MRHNYRRTVRSLWTWLWGRYHIPQNVFLVGISNCPCPFSNLVHFRTRGKVWLNCVEQPLCEWGKCETFYSVGLSSVINLNFVGQSFDKFVEDFSWLKHFFSICYLLLYSQDICAKSRCSRKIRENSQLWARLLGKEPQILNIYFRNMVWLQNMRQSMVKFRLVTSVDGVRKKKSEQN